MSEEGSRKVSKKRIGPDGRPKATQAQSTEINDRAGRAQARASRQGTFPFKELTAEIRNEIYKFALVADGPIRISRHENPTASKKKRRASHQTTGYLASYSIRPDTAYLVRAEVHSKHLRGNTRKITKFKSNYGKLHSVALLRVSKTIYVEAMPILYGEDKFELLNPAPFAEFMMMIGERRRLLRDVKLNAMKTNINRELLFPLAAATKLRRFEVAINCVRDELPLGYDIYQAVVHPVFSLRRGA